MSAHREAIRTARSLVVKIGTNALTTQSGVFDAGGLAGPTAWLFGNEAWGLPADLLALADLAVAVPIYGRAESLNLAAAAAVCLYASAGSLYPSAARSTAERDAARHRAERD